MYALNDVETQNEYEDATTLVCPGSVEVNITVENAPVLLQYALRSAGYSDKSPTWSPPNGIRFPPGFHTRGRNIEQIRVRSYEPGKPGKVTIEAVS